MQLKRIKVIDPRTGIQMTKVSPRMPWALKLAIAWAVVLTIILALGG